jgi:hypothetical protein
MNIVLYPDDVKKLCVKDRIVPVYFRSIWVGLLKITRPEDDERFILRDLHNRQQLTDWLTAEDMVNCLNTTLLQPDDYKLLFDGNNNNEAPILAMENLDLWPNRI